MGTRRRTRIVSRRAAIETQNHATETLGRESRATERVGTRQTWDHLLAPVENPRILQIQTEIKRKRDSGKKKDKSPDRLEKKERLRKEKEKLKKLAEEEEAAIEREKESKKERKRDRDSSGESEKKKRREDDDLSPKQNGDSKRKNRR